VSQNAAAENVAKSAANSVLRFVCQDNHHALGASNVLVPCCGFTVEWKLHVSYLRLIILQLKH
jgi:hypothetical protein